MDVGVPIRFRNPDPSSTHRLLGGGFSSQNPSPSSSSVADEDLSEDDIFSTVDFSETANRRQHRGDNLSGQVPAPAAAAAASSPRLGRHRSSGFGTPDGFGILAALPERETSCVFGRKASVSPSSPLSSSSAAPIPSSRMIPVIPRPPQDRFPLASFSLSEKYHQSAPVNVPVLMAKRHLEFVEVEDENGDGDDDKDFDGEEMLPPHEIVARRLSRSQSVACSVLEGAGRTLKGRDQRQIRNAVWRQTGFLD